MAKTKEELNTLKNEYETVTNKLQELTEDELNMVAGGNENSLMEQIIKISKKLVDKIQDN